MSKKSTRVEEIIEAIQDPRVLTSIAASLADTFKTLIESVIESQLDKLSSAILPKILPTIDESISRSVNKHFEPFLSKSKVFEETLINVDEKITSLEREALEKKLIITGIPEVVGNNQPVEFLSAQYSKEIDNLLALMNPHLPNPIVPINIVSFQRLPKRLNDKKLNRDILIELTSSNCKQFIYQNRFKLHKGLLRNESTVYVNEILSAANIKTFKKAREDKANKLIHSVWTWKGEVFYKLKNDSKPAKYSI